MPRLLCLLATTVVLAATCGLNATAGSDRQNPTTFWIVAQPVHNGQVTITLYLKVDKTFWYGGAGIRGCDPWLNPKTTSLAYDASFHLVKAPNIFTHSIHKTPSLYWEDPLARTGLSWEIADVPPVAKTWTLTLTFGLGRGYKQGNHETKYLCLDFHPFDAISSIRYESGYSPNFNNWGK